MSNFPVDGFVAPGFEAVRDTFERNFSDDIEVGASFSAVLDGRTVVNLWGGWQDRAATRPWLSDTLVNVYSTTKGLGAIAFATLVDEGLIRYEDEVRKFWPELRAGQGGLTVGELLAHKGGICGLREPVAVADLYDWGSMIRRLESEEPHWPPGSAAGYHAVLWGFLPGELARRLTGKMLGQIFAERIAAPLAADCHIGLPEVEHHRVADLIGPNHARRQPDLSTLADMVMPPLYPYALANPSIRPWQDACSPAWRNADLAAANGQAHARGIARIYGAMARGGELDGVRVLSTDAITALMAEEVGVEDDLVLGRPMRRGRGVMLNTEQGYGPNPAAYGHAGAGGSFGFADPDARLGVGYAMNQMQPGLEADTRGSRLVQSLYAAL